MRPTGTDYHIFEMHGDTIMALADGRIFLLDEIARRLVSSEYECEVGTAKDKAINRAKSELDYILSSEIKDHRYDKAPRKLRALCLNITHGCNLACNYCFASKLTKSNALSMSIGVIRDALEFLVYESGEVDRLQVDFFGGEPLLVFDMVKFAVEYGRLLMKKHRKKIYFTLTTNATILNDEIISFISDNKISLILSLDGRREVNDLHRKYRDGTGSFDDVYMNIKKIQAKLGKNDYYIRGTFTADTLDILETLRFFADEGFYNVSLEPVASAADAPYALTGERIESLIFDYRNAALWMLDKPIQFFHFNLEMDNPLCLTRRITGCGAGVEYMAVDPRGDIYPCHQFVEMENFRIGNVSTGIERKDLIKTFSEATIYHKSGCDKCWARFYCGGGCHYQQFVDMGNIMTPSPTYCKLFRGRLESALWFNVRKKIRLPDSKQIS